MTRWEKFNIINTIINFVAGIIGIATFIAGIWNSEPLSPGEIQISLIYKVVTGFILVYGWASLSYLLAARKVRSLYYSRKRIKVVKIAYNATIVIGLPIILPISVLWWYALIHQPYGKTMDDWLILLITPFSMVILGVLITIVLNALLPLVFTDIID